MKGSGIVDVLSFLWREAQAFRGKMAGVLSLLLLRVLMEAAGVYLLKKVIDSMTGGNSLPAFLLITTTYGVVAYSSGQLFVWQNRKHNEVGRRVMESIRNKLYRKMLKCSLQEIVKRPDLLVSVVSVFELEAEVSNLIMTYIYNVLMLVCYVTCIVLLLSPVLILPLLLLFFLLWHIYRAKARKRGEPDASGKSLLQRKKEAKARVLAMTEEAAALPGAVTIRLFEMFTILADGYRPVNQEFTNEGIEEQRTLLSLQRSTGELLSLVRVIVYLICGLQLLHRPLHIGALVLVLPAAAYQVSSVIGATALLASCTASLDLLFGTEQRLIDLLAPLREMVDFLRLPDTSENQAVDLENTDSSICVKEVEFRYPENEDKKGSSFGLGPVNFEVAPGTVCAIVGPSGSGKSTIGNILLGLYKPTKGSVEIGGRNIASLTSNQMARLLSAVPQQVFAFAATIRENILLGSTASSEELVEAARAARLHKEIEEQLGGYDRKLGKRGEGMSEGQKQRMAIARALLRRRRILILDEATSSLDSKNEYEFQMALLEIIRLTGMTVVVIAHRLSTIRQADRIIVLKEGKIVEEGTYAELLALKGEFAEFHRLQSGEVYESSAKAGESKTALPPKELVPPSIAMPPALARYNLESILQNLESVLQFGTREWRNALAVALRKKLLDSSAREDVEAALREEDDWMSACQTALKNTELSQEKKGELVALHLLSERFQNVFLDRLETLDQQKSGPKKAEEAS